MCGFSSVDVRVNVASLVRLRSSSARTCSILLTKNKEENSLLLLYMWAQVKGPPPLLNSYAWRTSRRTCVCARVCPRSNLWPWAPPLIIHVQRLHGLLLFSHACKGLLHAKTHELISFNSESSGFSAKNFPPLFYFIFLLLVQQIAFCNQTLVIFNIYLTLSECFLLNQLFFFFGKA